MIAAINRSGKFVLGIGRTADEAIDDAKKEFAQKSERIQALGLPKLETVRLRKNAPIDDPTESGLSLYRYCLIKHDQETQHAEQLELFT